MQIKKSFLSAAFTSLFLFYCCFAVTAQNVQPVTIRGTIKKDSGQAVLTRNNASLNEVVVVG